MDNVRKIAVGLKYDEDDKAPTVIAKGEGFVAEKILENANKHNVAIYEDNELANQLNCMQLNEEIPTQLYEAVAQVLVFISELDSK